MISQTDIIKTLVNKNCTDESVLSTALSKDCTPTKLLEKLTETERFDLALDISMKSGLDVRPLWRTWAMRCLKSRNFQGAREKFRHCFPRLRLPGYRVSPIQSGLLTEILDELSQMDETKLTLSEEIEIIRSRKSMFNVGEVKEDIDVTLRPTIFAECQYYLKEYGGLEDYIKFYARNNLWDHTVKTLKDNPNHVNLDKFFVGELIPSILSRGQFDDFLNVLSRPDSRLTESIRYFKSLYNFCASNRKYHLLVYIQSTLGDHLAAADTQLTQFYLKKPYRSYRELDERIQSLIDARDNYQIYLDKSESKPKTDAIQSSLFTVRSREEIERHLNLVRLQIDITRNFATNEVSGCMNGVEVPHTSEEPTVTLEQPHDSIPVTLFDKSEACKTFLAALVLIYYDVSCSSYLSKNGLDLAIKLIDELKLDKIRVFKTAMRIIIEDESCDILENATLLLERVRDDCIRTSAPAKSPHKRSPTKQQVTGQQQQQQGRGRRVALERESSVVKRNYFGSSPASSSSSSPLPPPPTSTTSGSNSSIGNAANLPSPTEGARRLCDEIIRDSIGSCREPDYKMELAKLLSGEAKIELYIELGKLSNAQRLAFSMNRPDYVSSIIEEAAKLNQNHVKTVCQLWLAKHETKNSIR